MRPLRVSGRCGEVETASLLVALRAKGETAEELAAAAAVLREHMIRLETGRDGVLDKAVAQTGNTRYALAQHTARHVVIGGR